MTDASSRPYAKIQALVSDLPEFHPTRLELYKAISRARRFEQFRSRLFYISACWFVIGIFIGAGFSS